MEHRPEDMRTAMANYIDAVHASYRSAAAHQPPAIRGRLPLLSSPFTVVAAGAQNLHVIATTETLASPHGQETLIEAANDEMAWTVRFYDPVVLPPLGTLDERSAAQPEAVRKITGISTHLYHLIVQPGSELTSHHASHAGTSLANAHLAAARDFEEIRAHAGRLAGLVDEMEGADLAGLTTAHRLLANEIAGTPLEGSDRAAIRKALLQSVRNR